MDMVMLIYLYLGLTLTANLEAGCGCPAVSASHNHHGVTAQRLLELRYRGAYPEHVRRGGLLQRQLKPLRYSPDHTPLRAAATSRARRPERRLARVGGSDHAPLPKPKRRFRIAPFCFFCSLGAAPAVRAAAQPASRRAGPRGRESHAAPGLVANPDVDEEGDPAVFAAGGYQRVWRPVQPAAVEAKVAADARRHEAGGVVQCGCGAAAAAATGADRRFRPEVILAFGRDGAARHDQRWRARVAKVGDCGEQRMDKETSLGVEIPRPCRSAAPPCHTHPRRRSVRLRQSR